MSSEKQRVANQINAQRSTGPRSDEGKAIVAQNALQHGLRSGAVVEDRSSHRRSGFGDFTATLRAELSPAGALQEIVFNQIATIGWKMLRMKRIERGLIRADRKQRRDELARHQAAYGPVADPVEPGALSDAHLIASWFRECSSAGRNAYVTLRRYEAGMERSFYRARAELKNLQADARERGAPLEGIDLAEQSQFSNGSSDSNDRPGHRLRAVAP